MDTLILKEVGIELTDYELAVRWWFRLSDKEKRALLLVYLPDGDSTNYDTAFYIWSKRQT
jgi:hypothetical protein